MLLLVWRAQFSFITQLIITGLYGLSSTRYCIIVKQVCWSGTTVPGLFPQLEITWNICCLAWFCSSSQNIIRPLKKEYLMYVCVSYKDQFFFRSTLHCPNRSWHPFEANLDTWPRYWTKRNWLWNVHGYTETRQKITIYSIFNILSLF